MNAQMDPIARDTELGFTQNLAKNGPFEKQRIGKPKRGKGEISSMSKRGSSSRMWTNVLRPLSFDLVMSLINKAMIS